MTATKIFVTGDRSMHEALGAMVGAAVLANVGATLSLEGENTVEFSTGDNQGFERGFARLLNTLGIAVQVVPTGVDPDTHKPAWDTRHEVVDAIADRVIVVHTDPLASSIGKSAVKVLGDKVSIFDPSSTL